MGFCKGSVKKRVSLIQPHTLYPTPQHHHHHTHTQEHPLDSTNEDGEPFWSGDRRVPKPSGFDPANALHMDFLTTAALLKARAFNVVDSDATAAELRPQVESLLGELLPEYQAPRRVDPPEEELEARIRREFEEVRRAVARIVGRAGKFGTVPQIFEKDDDANGHIDFVTAASNLRAINYGIAPADRLQVGTAYRSIDPPPADSHTSPRHPPRTPPHTLAHRPRRSRGGSSRPSPPPPPSSPASRAWSS